MRRLAALAVTVLFMVPVTAPTAAATHAPAPVLQEVMDDWRDAANATLSAAEEESIDAGNKESILADLDLKHRQGRPIELGLSAARALYFADYINLTAEAPEWDDTNDTTRKRSGNAHRLFVLNATDDLKAEADAALADAVARYAAFSPRTGAAADAAILGAYLIVIADLALKHEYNESRATLATEYVDPDVTTGVYRGAAQSLVFQTSGMIHLTALALDILDVARDLDAGGGTLLRPSLWEDLVDDHAARVAQPSFTAPGPDQPRMAAAADAAFDDGAPLLGLAGFLQFDKTRKKAADDFRFNQGSIDRDLVTDRLELAVGEAELALNETGVHGLAGAVLQNAVADARATAVLGATTTNLIGALSGVETALALHRALVVAVGGEGADEGLPTLAIVVGGLLLVAGLGVVLMRRRGAG